MVPISKRFVGWSILFPVLLGLSAGLAYCGYNARDPFADLPPNHWAYSAVKGLIDRGILDGYPDGTFRGKNLVTRYALAVTLAKAIQSIESKGGVGSSMAEGDLETLERLIKEFSDELAMLGVKTASLEERLKGQEREIDAIKLRLDEVEKGREDEENKKFFFESGEMRLVAYNKEDLNNMADVIVNMGFKVDDDVSGRVGLRYTSVFNQILSDFEGGGDLDEVNTYEAYADFSRLGPFDRFRAGRYNMFLGSGLTLFDRREGFLLSTERNDIQFELGYFDAQFFNVQTTLLGDAKVGFYFIKEDKNNGREPRHLGLYARGSASDTVRYEFELAEYDNDGQSAGGGAEATNRDDNTRALLLGLEWKSRKGPRKIRLGYIDQEEDYRALAVDSDLRYHNTRSVWLEDVLQAIRDATPFWVDPDELNGFTDFLIGMDFDIPSSPWKGRFNWDMVRSHSSALDNDDDEFDVLTLSLSREVRKNTSFELRFQTIIFDDEDSGTFVDSMPAFEREDETTVRGQLFVRF